MAAIEIEESELRVRVRKWAQQAAAEYLANRTTEIPAMAYFAPPDDSLVTYGVVSGVMAEVVQLRAELWALRRQTRPWWKRWLRR